MKNEKEYESVYNVTATIIHQMGSTLNISSTKAALAKLRNSIGKPLSQTIDIWPFVFEYLPEEFLGTNDSASNQEKAILTSLQLFAVYQQGSAENMSLNKANNFHSNLGTSLSTIRGEDSASVDRRFNALITSQTFEELVHHLRQMLSLLKAKSKKEVKVDFPKLSQDLYWYLTGQKEQVCLNWSREYYRRRNSEKKEGEFDNEKQ